MNEPITQVQDHESRIGRLEGIVEQINLRLDSIERLIAEQGRQTQAQFSQMQAQFNQMQTQMHTMFRWMVGIQITVLLAMVGLVVGLLLK